MVNVYSYLMERTNLLTFKMIFLNSPVGYLTFLNLDKTHRVRVNPTGNSGVTTAICTTIVIYTKQKVCKKILYQCINT